MINQIESYMLVYCIFKLNHHFPLISLPASSYFSSSIIFLTPSITLKTRAVSDLPILSAFDIS